MSIWVLFFLLHPHATVIYRHQLKTKEAENIPPPQKKSVKESNFKINGDIKLNVMMTYKFNVVLLLPTVIEAEIDKNLIGIRGNVHPKGGEVK